MTTKTATEAPAANAAAEPAAKSTTHTSTKHSAKSCAKSGTDSSAKSDTKTRRIYGHLAIRILSGIILSLLIPRCHFRCLELRNIQLLKLILKISHLIKPPVIFFDIDMIPTYGRSSAFVTESKTY